jgi:RNA polymerase sigma factor (sigma-70 family)
MAPLLRRQTTDAAFERLYRRHVKDVYRYAFAVLGERADAEDVTQTTFLNAYRAFQRGERPQKPQNWLIAIAHNVCRQRFRQSQRRPREVEFDDAIGNAAVEEAEGPSVEDLRRAFSQLPPNQRAALVMRELEGRSYAEIATVLEISVSALETLLFRARRSLREQLEDQLTCSEAAFAVSKQADGRLSHAEQRALRAHLRACPECSSAANRQRAQRRVLKTMLAVPLPQSLGSFFGGGAAVGTASTAAAVGGTGVVLKAAAVLTAGVVVGGGAYVGVEQKPLLHRSHAAVVAPKAPAQKTKAAAAPAPRPVHVTVGPVRRPPPRPAKAHPKPVAKPLPKPARPTVVSLPPVAQRPAPQAERQAEQRAEQQARKAALETRKAAAAAQRKAAGAEAKRQRAAAKAQQHGTAKSTAKGVSKGKAKGRAKAHANATHAAVPPAASSHGNGPRPKPARTNDNGNGDNGSSGKGHGASQDAAAALPADDLVAP